jgi:hypothetical protein
MAGKRAGKVKSLDWVAIKHAFVAGTMSPAEHAATFGVLNDTMRQRVARGGWIEARRELSRSVAAVAQAKLIKTKAQELSEFNDADARMSRALRGVAARMLTDASKPGAHKLTATEARTIASLAESAQKIGRIALGATTENVGHGGLLGAPPILTGEVPSAAVTKAMNEYLHDF